MGITLIVICTSVPKAFAFKAAAIQDVHADNTVGNIIGYIAAKVFLGKGMAWSMAAIYWAAKGEQFWLTRSIVSPRHLFSTIIFLIGTSHANNWKMDKAYGIKLIFWYLIAISVACLYE